MSYVNDLLESDAVVDQLIREYDESFMPLPDMEYEPHLLISKVRKHYMDYLIKQLMLNYETHQNLMNKNIYLPSAIWRCAKIIETKAAQMCMVVQIYRKHIVSAIKELKTDTKRGKLNRKLYECLHYPPMNDKKMQTTSESSDCNCQCHCSFKRRRNVSPESTQLETAKNLNSYSKTTDVTNEIPKNIVQSTHASQTENLNNSPKPSTCISVESQDSDELTLQLEKLFQNDPNDDDLFDGSLCDAINDDSKKIQYGHVESTEPGIESQGSIINDEAKKTVSLDERLATMFENNTTKMIDTTQTAIDTTQNKVEPEKTKPKQSTTTKWLCEEHFLKTRYFDLLDQIGDTNRNKLFRIKYLLHELFGEDSDDEAVVSPMNETPEFVISCKERIAPWVVKLLTPHYIKGRIRGKALFKSLAKHLIRLIYQCSRYPSEYEVNSFISDFLETHKMIRCEADFMQFKIYNI